MKKIIKFTCLAVLTSVVYTSYAQNQMHLSQYMLQQPFLNPASMASRTGLNGALLFKKQWIGFDGAPTIEGLNVNANPKGGSSFVGLTVINDKIGVNTRMDISALYAYKITLNQESSLAFGLAGTVAMLQSNYGDVMVFDANDPVYSANTQNYIAPDFKFGAYYFTKKYYVGFALPNILDNEIIFDQDFKNRTRFNAKNLHYHLHGGYLFSFSDNMNLSTDVLFKEVYGAPLQIDINAQLIFNKRIGVGITYRTAKIITGMLNFKFNDYLKLGYAYDYNFTQLSKVSSGSHEVMLLFNYAPKKVGVRIDDPRF